MSLCLDSDKKMEKNIVIATFLNIAKYFKYFIFFNLLKTSTVIRTVESSYASWSREDVSVVVWELDKVYLR